MKLIDSCMKFMMEIQHHVKLSQSGETCLRTKLQIMMTMSMRENQETNESILANRHLTINKNSNELGVSHGNVHKIAAQLIFLKVCSRWLPHTNRGI